MSVLELEKRSWARREAKEADEAREVAARLATVKLTVAKRAGENGLLYGSVTTSEIAELLAAQGVAVDRRKIRLDDPIKTVGEHKVQVRLREGLAVEITVNVVGEA